MTKLAFANNAATTLTASIDNSTTTVPVVSTAGFPLVAPGVTDYYITLVSIARVVEICKVASVTATSFEVIRGQEGTTAIQFTQNATIVEHRATAATFNKFAQFEENYTPATGELFTVDANGAVVAIALERATVVATTDPQQDFVAPEPIDLVPDAINVYLNGVLQTDYTVVSNDTIRFTNTPYPYTGDVVRVLYMELA